MTSTSDLTFSHLSLKHADQVYAIEQALLEADRGLETRLEIHPKTLDRYRELLSPGSTEHFIGGFAGNRLLGYGAYTAPANTNELRKYEDVSVTAKAYRPAALATCGRSRTGMILGGRVHPDFQKNGVGSSIARARLATMMGLEAPGRLTSRCPKVPIVLTNVTLSNDKSVLTQFSAGRNFVTSVIMSAGYEIDSHSGTVQPVVYLAHINPSIVEQSELKPQLSLQQNYALGSGSHDEFVLGEGFPDLAKLLDAGHVAWPDPEDPRKLQIGARPQKIQPLYPTI